MLNQHNLISPLGHQIYSSWAGQQRLPKSKEITDETTIVTMINDSADHHADDDDESDDHADEDDDDEDDLLARPLFNGSPESCIQSM